MFYTVTPAWGTFINHMWDDLCERWLQVPESDAVKVTTITKNHGKQDNSLEKTLFPKAVVEWCVQVANTGATPPGPESPIRTLDGDPFTVTPYALRFAHNVIDGNVNTVWHDDIVDSIVATALYDLD